MKKVIPVILSLLPLLNYAQSLSFRYDQKPTITSNGQRLPNAWAGGLNACQFSTMRLNDDDRDDLVVFDRTSNKISTFIWTNTGWQYDPTYETAFPATLNWMLLVDFDGDGKKDLFSYSVSGVRALRNTSSAGKVSWQVAADPIQTIGLAGKQPLYVSPTDMPVITDMDDDGDIDIISFDPGGDYTVLQQNQSRDKNLPAGLDFKRIGFCWGNFIKEHCTDFRFGYNCQDGSGRTGNTVPGARPAHQGNTIALFDANGDGRKDLLFGHVSCENIALIRNGGPNTALANFTSFEASFPPKEPVSFQIFPATFLEDVDGDGKKDLISSPNTYGNEGTLMDFQSSNWFYKNIGTNQLPDFQLVQKNFLQKDMVDLGENAAPALADMDGDGDVDMLVGNSGIRGDQGYRASLWYFENKGTSRDPDFELITTDYLKLSQSLLLTELTPRFADIDGNGSLDLILTATSFKGVEIRVLFNPAGRGAAARYDLATAKLLATPPQMGSGDAPTFVDVDRDGKMDMLVGRFTGNIAYYRNTGSGTEPAFQLIAEEFGGTKINLLTRTPSLAVIDLNGDQRPELVSGSRNGQLKLYQFPEQPTQPLVLVDSLPALGMAGGALMVSAADLDGDQLPDLVIGTQGGGLRYLKNTSEKVVITGVDTEEPILAWAYPNPTERFVTVRPPQDGQVDVISLSGQLLMPAIPVRALNETTFDLGTLGEGTYLIRLNAENKTSRIQKVVVWK